MKIPTRMPSGGCILGICILGAAIRVNPDTYAFWGSHFGYLHSGGCDSCKSRHVCLLGVAFWELAFWGLRFVKNPDTYAFWGLHFGYLHSGGCDS